MDAMAVSQANHRVILENEHVRVLDTRVAPGERTAIHCHEWPAALYVLSWSDFLRYDEHGTVVLDSRQIDPRPGPGDALWGAPLVPHCVENVGKGDLHIIAVELKRV
jgi:quercetin dioxygenase-like cupin family protein